MADARTAAAADRLRDDIWAAWWDRAACRGYPTEWWMPSDSDATVDPEAVRICRACPVRDACRDHATRHREHGYWGSAPHERHRTH